MGMDRRITVQILDRAVWPKSGGVEYRSMGYAVSTPARHSW
jgi:hypothetical protein